MLRARNLSRWLAIMVCCTPALAHASDFSVLLYFLYGICAVVALGLWFVARHSARAVRSPLARAAIWGTWSALVLTPLSVHGGNGTLTGTPMLALASMIFGADPAYIAGALKALVVSVPACTAVIWLGHRFVLADAPQDKGTDGDA
jgi:hypothetical protein